MARPLQVLSLLSRLGALSVRPPLSVTGCRLASRRASPAGPVRSPVLRDRAPLRATGYSDEVSDDEFEEDVEDKIQAVIDKERRRQKAIKFHKLKRQMTPSGPPQRKLSWDAMEQIRYLKQQQPEEWTVERLAQGYSVSTDVISRVLRSKFVPTPERKARQDAKAMAGLGQQVLPSGAGTVQDRLKLPGKQTAAALPPGAGKGAVVPVAERTLMLRGEDLAANSPAPVSLLPTQFSAAVRQDDPEEYSTSYSNPTEEEEEGKEEEEEEESWDGQILTEEQLEEFMGMEKPEPMVQVGNDFFDAEGNFLFRI